MRTLQGSSAKRLKREVFFIQHGLTGHFLCDIQGNKPQWTADPHKGFPYMTINAIAEQIREVWDFHNEPHAQVTAVIFWADPAFPTIWHVGSNDID